MIEVNPLIIAKTLVDRSINLKSFYDSDNGGFKALLTLSDKEIELEKLGDIRDKISKRMIFSLVKNEKGLLFSWGLNPHVFLSFEKDKNLGFYKKESTFDFNFSIPVSDLNQDSILQLTLEYGIRKSEITEEEYNFIFL